MFFQQLHVRRRLPQETYQMNVIQALVKIVDTFVTRATNPTRVYH